MDQKKAEPIKAARISQVINEEPFVFEVDIKKRAWWQRLFRIKRTVRQFTVYPPTLGTMIKIGAEVEKLQGVKEMFEQKDYGTVLSHFAANGAAIVGILALYLGGFGIKSFIRENINNEEAASLLLKLIEFSNLKDFMTSIILVKGMSLMKTEEIIAPSKNEDLKTLEGLLGT